MQLPLLYSAVGYVSWMIPERLRVPLGRLTQSHTTLGKALDLVAPHSRVPVQVTGGVLRGARLCLDFSTEREYWLGIYERWLTLAMRRVCTPGMIVYDIGANIGYTSLLFARLVGPHGAIYAFEPLPENVQRLSEHIAHNPGGAPVHVIPCALSDGEGQEAFLVHRSGAMGKLSGSADRDTSYESVTAVSSVRLDDFVFRDGNPLPHVIKVDIEGGAVKALPGSVRVIAAARPIFLLELHGPEERQVAWDVLRLHNYRWHAMRRGYPEISRLTDLDDRWRQHVVAMPLP
jgi:FkbM family methyltransferase